MEDIKTKKEILVGKQASLVTTNVGFTSCCRRPSCTYFLELCGKPLWQTVKAFHLYHPHKLIVKGYRKHFQIIH